MHLARFHSRIRASCHLTFLLHWHVHVHSILSFSIPIGSSPRSLYSAVGRTHTSPPLLTVTIFFIHLQANIKHRTPCGYLENKKKEGWERTQAHTHTHRTHTIGECMANNIGNTLGSLRDPKTKVYIHSRSSRVRPAPGVLYFNTVIQSMW